MNGQGTTIAREEIARLREALVTLKLMEGDELDITSGKTRDEIIEQALEGK